MSSMSPITLEGVYYVESPDRPLGHIAIRPKFMEHDAEWDDTSMGVAVHLDDSSPHWEQVHTTSPENLIDRISLVYNRTKRAITFQYLTLDIYNEKLKSKVAGHPSFSSTKDVQEYYLKTNFYRSE